MSDNLSINARHGYWGALLELYADYATGEWWIVVKTSSMLIHYPMPPKEFKIGPMTEKEAREKHTLLMILSHDVIEAIDPFMDEVKRLHEETT